MDLKLKLGDLLYRSKGFVEHAAVYIGKNKVIHTSPENGTEVISIEEYGASQTIKVVRTNLSNQDLLAKRLDEILSNSPDYQLFTGNCEHLASYLIHGRKASPQIQAAFCGAIVGLILGQRMGVWEKVALVAIGALIGCYATNLNRKYDSQLHDYRKYESAMLEN